MLLVQQAPAAHPRSRLQKSRVRFKSILAEKTLVLQSTLIARRPRQTLQMRASAGLGLKLPLRKMVFGFSVTARAMTTFARMAPVA